jgi:hypothetical protein
VVHAWTNRRPHPKKTLQRNPDTARHMVRGCIRTERSHGCQSRTVSLGLGRFAPHAGLGTQRRIARAGRSSIYRPQAQTPLVKIDRARRKAMVEEVERTGATGQRCLSGLVGGQNLFSAMAIRSGLCSTGKIGRSHFAGGPAADFAGNRGQATPALKRRSTDSSSRTSP